MLSTFVGLRQVYLYVVTHYIANTPKLVGLGYPVGWVSCCAVEIIYYVIRRRKREQERIQNAASDLLSQEMTKAMDGSTFSQKALEDSVKGRIQEQLSDVEILSFETVNASFPDIELYKKAKEKYIENLEKKQEMIAQQEKESTDFNNKIDQRIELLKKYGELLTQYPVLIEYFKTKNESLLPDDIKIEDIIK